MKRQDTVTMDGEEFDSIHTNLWLITDIIDRNDVHAADEEMVKNIKRYAQDALDIMDREED